LDIWFLELFAFLYFIKIQPAFF